MLSTKGVFMALSFETNPSSLEVKSIVESYIDQQVNHLEWLHDFFPGALALVENVPTSNALLENQGRPDLAITSPAHLKTLTDPETFLYDCGNFKLKFDIGGAPPRVVTAPNDSGLQFQVIKTPVVEAELTSLMNDTSTISQLPPHNHLRKNAFLRMLVLFPDFTKQLVLGLSPPEGRVPFEKYSSDLFIAYQLMSRLVDTADAGVIATGNMGQNDSYLCS